MNLDESKAAVDKLCDEIAWLLFGQTYEGLSPESKDKVIAEAVLRFDPRMVDYADRLERR